MTILRRLLQISWRNVFRNKRRSLLTLMVLVLGNTGLVLVGGFFESMKDRLRETVIHSSFGHLQVSQEGYFEKGNINPLSYLLKDVAQTQRSIESTSHVEYTVPRIKFGGMLSSEDSSLSVIALGVDPVREKRISEHKYINAKNPAVRIVMGQDLDPSDPEGIIIGLPLMKSLGLKVGDSVSFITTRNSGAIDGSEFRVRGAFETVLKEVGERLIKMNLSTAQNLLAIPDQVHSLLVVLDHTDRTEEVKTVLQGQFRAQNQPLEVYTWMQQGAFYQQAEALMDRVYLVMQIIITVIFIFSIANTINMAIFERMREYGTMMAIGNNRITIFATIFLEAIILGILGVFLGIGVSVFVARIVSWIGIEMPPLPSMTSAGSYVVNIMTTPSLLLETAMVSFVATMLSSIIPGYRASHIRIVKALGYV